MRDSSRERWKALRDAADSLERLAAAEGWNFTYELTPEGTNEMNMIQPQPGESMVDAMTRMAKEQVAAGAIKQGPPLKKIEKVAKTAKKASSKSPKLETTDEQKKVDEGQPVDVEVYSAIHVYRRAGDTDGKVRYNAHHEREMHGPGTVVFCHMHSFGETCGSACKAKVEAE